MSSLEVVLYPERASRIDLSKVISDYASHRFPFGINTLVTPLRMRGALDRLTQIIELQATLDRIKFNVV